MWHGSIVPRLLEKLELHNKKGDRLTAHSMKKM
jgi:hypothetical protein